MRITRDLVEFCSQCKYRDLPAAVIDKAKYFMLDFIGVAARGSVVESSRVIYEVICSLGVEGKGTVVIGTDMRASPQYAALANGTSSHSIEMDDVNNAASLHPGVANFPVALAMGEVARADGEKLIEGVTLGYEVTVRLGRALGPSEHYARGFHPTATCGAFGATIVAAKMLGLDEARMVHALGIVGTMVSGTMECLGENAWTKRVNPGWAAHNGVMAALLAQKGFRGSSTIIEGEHGFLHMGSGDPSPEKVVDGLGLSYAIGRTSVKPYACCRYKQGPIDAVLKIIIENDIRPEDVEKVTLGMLKTGIPFVVKPEQKRYDPKSLIEAQFSMPFGAAVAVLYGKAGLEEYTPEKWESPEVKRMMSRVYCVEDPQLEKDYPEKWPATAEIRTRDGRRFFARIDYPKGDPENPLSWEELTEKFDNLTKPIYSEARRNEIIRKTRQLENEEDMSELAPLLVKESVARE